MPILRVFCILSCMQILALLCGEAWASPHVIQTGKEFSMLKTRKMHIMVLLGLMIALAVKADIVTDGLVAYWSLDASTIKGDEVEDIVGDNDGVIKGKVTRTAGKINEALEFDGASSVDIGGTDALNFNGKEGLSVCAWANVGAKEPVIGVVAGCCGTIVAQRDVDGWALRYDGRDPGKEMEFIACPNWQGHEDLGAPIGDFKEGEWHYLTGVVDDTKLLLYVDGKLVKERGFAGPITSKGPETEIGHANDGGFIGIIDEVAIYDKALTEAEVIQNFRSTRFFVVGSMGKLSIAWAAIKAR